MFIQLSFVSKDYDSIYNIERDAQFIHDVLNINFLHCNRIITSKDNVINFNLHVKRHNDVFDFQIISKSHFALFEFNHGDIV